MRDVQRDNDACDNEAEHEESTVESDFITVIIFHREARNKPPELLFYANSMPSLEDYILEDII